MGWFPIFQLLRLWEGHASRDKSHSNQYKNVLGATNVQVSDFEGDGFKNKQTSSRKSRRDEGYDEAGEGSSMTGSPGPHDSSERPLSGVDNCIGEAMRPSGGRLIQTEGCSGIASTNSLNQKRAWIT